MTPAERREALVFDKCHERARRELRKAANEACQLTLTMQRRYPTGVMGVEGPGCPESTVYRIPHQKEAKLQAAKATHAAGRFENLRSKRDTQLPYNCLHHDATNATQERIFQQKIATGHSSSEEQLRHYGLRPSGKNVDGGYRSNQEQRLVEGDGDTYRARRLHTQSTGGKPFDIISGAELSIAPDVRVSDRIDRRTHPSNFAMPRTSGWNATFVGPIPDSHQSEWKPHSSTKALDPTK
eukprot:CAMPEP_0181185628 /NCGR_PEP_ID=MMETSP1096-20121128/9607_1 /TAXON_ID=156174 ORGANISM="Chrysochromulina ericina, Strain CCMP281" /NCGR_SAMPLE_ID=MMETSP1096 /ASSEMBLY_ACC=CAM_ASM_000453 /LENGTH=238 /DNA_ID=CAMNT_0023274481 /DNA_START=30 /DNA_END=743 /DNA_ORIENTATION=+